MIVIADDLTGATEIGGIGLRYNLTVDVLTAPCAIRSGADLIVVNADTRSKSKIEAIAVIRKISKQIKDFSPSLVFKKIDSVLRGYVIAEIATQAEVFSQQRAIIVPANPHLGRIIKNGLYYIDGKPIHETGFADDPEFPRGNAEVITLLENNPKVKVHTIHDNLPVSGWIVGEATNESELSQWAGFETAGTLLAGSAGFFKALLAKRFEDFARYHQERVILQYPLLYVCGSKFESGRALVQSLNKYGNYVSYIPEELLSLSPEMPAAIALMSNWKNEIKAIMKERGKAIIAVNNLLSDNNLALPKVIKGYMALVVKALFEDTEINELIIEGGATASEILKALNENHLQMVQELAQGLTRSIMANHKTHVTLKPGSYSWTSDIWKF